MKHFHLNVRVIGLLVSLAVVASEPVQATDKVAMPTDQVVPIDPNVKIGHLPNGFTYYIRKNTEPKSRVTLYLVNKVGSILETDEEQGLAHFLEHMSFNGTKHFPKNELVDYLQKSGVKFGGDLNAYTNFDETVYQLPLPSDDPVLLRNGFQIMRDWAQDVLLDSLEIEKERGVILEEKRLGKNMQERLRNKLFPVMVNQSNYADRIPIGTEEILKTFSRSTIQSFYGKWYRPNLQALIVVGDIDPAATETTVKSLFADLRNPDPLPNRTKYTIPLLQKNQFFTMTDKELTFPIIQVITKFEHEPLKTKADYRQNICRTFFNNMLAERFSDLSKKSNSPFIEAGCSVGDFLANLDACITEVVSKPDQMQSAFKTVWTELERVKRYGFTDSELYRVKQVFLTNLEYAYQERTKTPSGSFVEEYLRHFLREEAIPGMDREYPLCKELVAGINLQDVNACSKRYLLENNCDLVVLGPDLNKDSLPNEAVLLRWMGEVQQSKIDSYEDLTLNQPLLPNKPTGGKIVSEIQNKALGLTELRLSNGVRVYLKPTDFKNDEILFQAFSPGGTSLYVDADYESAIRSAECARFGGLGSFNMIQLQKYLNAKRVSVSPYIQERFEGFEGSSSNADLETALQLVYSFVTQPRKDFSIYQLELERAKASMANRGLDPGNVFSDTIAAVMSEYNIRRTGPSVDKIKQVNLERSFEIYRERFSDAGDFTFVFVGNFDVEKVKPLLAQYLGALPSTGRNEYALDLNNSMPEGKIIRNVYRESEDKTSVRLVFSGEYAYGEDENNQLNFLANLLTIKLTETLREKESGVYGVRAKASFSKYPQGRYSITIAFGCAPGNVDKLIQSALNVVEQLKTSLPAQTDVDKVVNEDLRSTEVQLKKNDFWLNYLSSRFMLDENPERILTYKESLRKITPQALQTAAGLYLGGTNLARFVLYPEKMER